MFYNEKQEKESKIKELQILKEEAPPIEIKELKAKYESLKLAQQKEYQTRKEKEAKLEASHAEHQKKIQELDDLYVQFDELYEQNSSKDDKINTLSQDLSKSQAELQALEAKII